MKGAYAFSGTGQRREQGVSFGGLGAGSIGRTYRGIFGRWQLYPGRKSEKIVYGDSFHLRLEKPEARFCATLSPEGPKRGLDSWHWGMDGATADYRALYPKAWTSYAVPGFDVEITCEQLTPFIPGNYADSSFPCGVFLWELTNRGGAAIEASVMFTWENDDGDSSEPARGDGIRFSRAAAEHERVGFPVATGAAKGVVMRRDSDPSGKGPVSFFIGAQEGGGVTVSSTRLFDADSDGAAVWVGFEREGVLYDGQAPEKAGTGGAPVTQQDAAAGGAPVFQRTSPSGGTPDVRADAAAVCAAFRIPAGETITVPFVIAWDIPLVRFGSGRRWYRRYTKFFGRDGKNVTEIARVAFERHSQWNAAIAAFQEPVLAHPLLPDTIKAALFNELYYLADGGTFWSDGEADEGSAGGPRYEDDGLGRFGYLECFDYDMVNTFDVHFYARHALAETFPLLQKALVRDFASCVLAEDGEMRLTVLDGRPVVRKPFGICPHDLGSPKEDPFYKINHYDFHDSSVWKDLNSKFVIQVFAEIVDGRGGGGFLENCWPAVEAAMETLSRFDADGDGIPENSGRPDQTYDTWTMLGPSAYCGGLWITANAAASRMAGALGKRDEATRYGEGAARAKATYESRLFNGRFYLFDTRPENSDLVMADQLCGEFWARLLGLSEAMLDPDRVRTALATIFELNVIKYGGGKLGAVNGMRTDGRVDVSSMQARETWIGTTYALAALMLSAGMTREGFETAGGLCATLRGLGYTFRTPEAIDRRGDYRAAQYMRPLSIWSIWRSMRRSCPDY